MITGIVLASGYGRRFGENKLLYPFRGQPLFTHSLTAIKKSALDMVVVVTQYPEIVEYANHMGLLSVQNKHSHLGQSQSVHLGVSSTPTDSDFVFFVADQPLLTSCVIDEIIHEFYKHSDCILQPTVNNNPASPVVFPAHLRSQLLAVTGDQGGRQVIDQNQSILRQYPVSSPQSLRDVDTKEELLELESNGNR